MTKHRSLDTAKTLAKWIEAYRTITLSELCVLTGFAPSTIKEYASMLSTYNKAIEVHGDLFYYVPKAVDSKKMVELSRQIIEVNVKDNSHQEKEPTPKESSSE